MISIETCFFIAPEAVFASVDQLFDMSGFRVLSGCQKKRSVIQTVFSTTTFAAIP